MLNGELPASQLVVIPWDGRDRVRFYALASLTRLNDAFRAVFGHNLIINEGYRDLATQKKYYKNPPSGVGTAAKPGTSNHGWGLAVDLRLTTVEYRWMLANAPRYGWINPLWARDGKGIEEPWHWEHVGAPTVIPDRIVLNDKENEVRILICHDARRGYWFVGPGHAHQFNQNPHYTDEFSGFMSRNPGFPVVEYPAGDAGVRAFDTDKAVWTQARL